METIGIYRGGIAKDTDGNTIQDDPVLWRELPALVAPAQQVEAAGTDGMPVEFDYTLYVRSPEPSGIRESDLVKVRGVTARIVGTVAVWHDRAGAHVGDVINVGLRKG